MEKLNDNIYVSQIAGGLDDMEMLREKEYYREKIIEMVEKIENSLILKLIYGFTKSGYEEEKAGRK